jgi:hypothetical protein
MKAPFLPELHAFHAASTGAQPGDFVVQWQSSFGLVVIEVRGEQVYVDGKLVQPAVVPGSQT